MLSDKAPLGLNGMMLRLSMDALNQSDHRQHLYRHRACTRRTVGGTTYSLSTGCFQQFSVSGVCQCTAVMFVQEKSGLRYETQRLLAHVMRAYGSDTPVRLI